ncbi:hypothetical protein BDV12DRAFT_200892 [Aspergillus spectabilis]
MRRPLYGLSSLVLASLRTHTCPKSCRPYYWPTLPIEDIKDPFTRRMRQWNNRPDNRPLEGHELAIPYLYTPLPDELPTGVHKDLLLLYAAYVGNIDRYVRLRDPNNFIDYEFDCVIRGIYHDTMFAKWWSLLPDHPDSLGLMYAIRAACYARFIMNNDLTHIDKETDEENFPYVIWYPHFALRETYVELARRKPAMTSQAARACIMADYEDEYKRINPTPDWFLLDQAERQQATNPFYLEDLQRRTKEMGIDIEEPSVPDEWKIWEERHLKFWRAWSVCSEVSPRRMIHAEDYNKYYESFGADMSSLEVYISTSDELRAQAKRTHGVDLEEMYRRAITQGES